jgi:hypothetical protein
MKIYMFVFRFCQMLVYKDFIKSFRVNRNKKHLNETKTITLSIVNSKIGVSKKRYEIWNGSLITDMGAHNIQEPRM